jgi:hypothetical protein
MLQLAEARVVEPTTPISSTRMIIINEITLEGGRRFFLLSVPFLSIKIRNPSYIRINTEKKYNTR